MLPSWLDSPLDTKSFDDQTELTLSDSNTYLFYDNNEDGVRVTK